MVGWVFPNICVQLAPGHRGMAFIVQPLQTYRGILPKVLPEAAMPRAGGYF